MKQKIDALPQGSEWFHEIIQSVGNVRDDNGEPVIEELELWRRDPVECVKELIGNPAFDGKMAYAPEQVFANIAEEEQIRDEMWTGEWWWNMQVRTG